MGTHQIIAMQTALTKTNHLYWKCKTKQGEWVNVFNSDDPKKNTFGLFDQAGYSAAMLSMDKPGLKATWEQWPIECTLIKKGDWPEITAVEPRKDGAAPDPIFVPDLDWYRVQARRWAANFRVDQYAVYIDCEATDKNPRRSEMLSICVLDWMGNTLLSTLVKPLDLDAIAKAHDVHRLTVEDFASAPTLDEIWHDLSGILYNKQAVIYNAQYDATLLESAAILHKRAPIIFRGVHDAMKWAAKYQGNWNTSWQRWESNKLGEAAAALGVQVNQDQAHNAEADTRTLYNLVGQIALETTSAGIPV